MIYVDGVGIPAAVWNKRTGRYVESRWYHLITDQLDPAELHEFAVGKLGLHRSYFQTNGPGGPGHDHYDVTIGKRRLAIRLGASSITGIELGRITIGKTRAWRATQARELCPACVHPLGDHEHRFEHAPQPSYEVLTCQRPCCDCVIDH